MATIRFTGIQPNNDFGMGFTKNESSSLSFTIPLVSVIDFSKAKNLKWFFREANITKGVDLPDGFGQEAINMAAFYGYCSNLTSVTFPRGFGREAIDLSMFLAYAKIKSVHLPEGFGKNARATFSMFNNCKLLESVVFPDGFGGKITTAYNMFSRCTSLVSLHFPTGFGLSCTNLNYTFLECTKLTNITGNPNFKVSISFSDSPLLTHDSLMVVINGLQTVTSKQTLTFGATNLAKLTDEEKKVATDKGWTLA